MGILDGKVAVVTGASRGIGAEIARRFGREGAAVAVAARTTETGTSPLPGTIAETFTRVMLLGSQNTSEAARRHADLVIKPRAEGVGLLEFHQLDTAREAGRIAARQALERVSASPVADPSTPLGRSAAGSSEVVL